MKTFRLAAVISAAAALFGLLVWGLRDLDDLGSAADSYRDAILSSAKSERHVLNAVAAVNFDYRGFDTLGEEFIFFASVVGVALLLRDEKDAEQPLAAGRRRRTAAEERGWLPAEPVSLVSLPALVGTLLVGGYIVLQGHLSPGGGFQGGIVISAAALLMVLSGGAEILYRTLPKAALEALESLGIGSYLIIGLFGPAVGRPYLTNVLPLGQAGELLSTGTIWAINFGVGVAVAAGFALLTVDFVQPLDRLPRRRHR